MTDSPQNPDDVNLSLEDAQAFLANRGIKRHPETLRNYAREGTLPFFKFNPDNPRDPYLIRTGDLRKYIMEKQIQACRRTAAG